MDAPLLSAWQPPPQPQMFGYPVGAGPAYAPGGYGPTTRAAANGLPERASGLLRALIGAPDDAESARLSELYQRVRETPASEGIFPQSMREFGREAFPYMMNAATFGGVNAKNAPLADLAKAEAMEKAGAAADDIWRATGWGRGADKKWRFEIDDSGAALTEAGKRGGDIFYDATSKVPAPDIERHKAAGVIEHPDLYRAYDDVPDIETRFRRMEPGGSYNHGKSSYAPSGFHESIDISAIGSDRKGTALHELQHAVQQREGFARGGSAEAAAKYANEYLASIQDNAPELWRDVTKFMDLDALVSSGRATETDWTAYETLMARIEKEPGGKNAIDALFATQKAPGVVSMNEHGIYRRLAGEVEARNVQSRMDMDAATRRQTPPWATEDVPRDQQIVRGLLDSSEPQMSISGQNENGILDFGAKKQARDQRVLIDKIESAIKSIPYRQDAEAAKAFSYHADGKLPLPVGTKMLPPGGKGRPTDVYEIVGYNVDPKNADVYGYNIRSSAGDAGYLPVSDPKLGVRERSPVSISGWTAAVGPNGAEKINYVQPTWTPRSNPPRVLAPDDRAAIDAEYASLFGPSEPQMSASLPRDQQIIRGLLGQ